MTETTDSNEAETAQKRRVGRSPAYPFFSVLKAVAHAKALHAQEGDYAAPLASALKAWGYGPKSSGGRQTLATMKYYGLIDISGEGDGRMIKVADIARRILLDQREDQSEKRALIRKVALTPAVHKSLLKEYPRGLASDGTVAHFLMFTEGFKQDAAKEIIAEFKETARAAGLFEPHNSVDKKDENSDNSGGKNERPAVKVGDKIQWTSQGSDQFRDGATVLGLSDDGQWVFTDQTGTGLPIKDVSVMEAAQETVALTPPPMPAHLMKQKQEETTPKAARKAVFPISDGDVTLTFPEGITDAGLKRLKRYLEIFLDEQIEIAGSDRPN